MKSQIIEETHNLQDLNQGHLYTDSGDNSTIWLYTSDFKFVVVFSNELCEGYLVDEDHLGIPTLWKGTLQLTQD